MAPFPLHAACRALAALLILLVPAWSVRAQVPPAFVPPTQQPGTSSSAAGDDTAVVHGALRKSIEKFQDSWRSTWQKVEIKRHNYINLSQIRGWGVRSNGIIEEPVWTGDRSALNFTTELRRYLAILCNVDSPSDEQIEYIKARKGTDIGSRNQFKAAPIGQNASGAKSSLRASAFQSELSFLSPRIITPSPNYGSICPAWIPDNERLPLDEGEALDLALPTASREPLRREREVLITTLAAAKARYPSDEWIIGQHFRFVLDQRTPSRTLEAARECRGSEKFCLRLLGLAFESLGNTAEAELSFRRAADLEMTSATADTSRCIDGELLLLLNPADRSAAQRGTCVEQRMFVQRLWWLADPMWSVPGNERLAAHESRRFHGTLRAALDRDERYVWSKLGGGEAFRELIVRYGWPGYTYWPGGQLEEEINKIRENPARPRVVAPPYTAVEYSSDRTALIPAVDAIANPFDSRNSHWNLRLREGSSLDTWWPQEHMMLWTKLHALEPGQQSQWRRDSAVVFAMVVDNPLFSLDTGARGPSTAALVASSSPDDIRVLWKSGLLSGEVLRMRGNLDSRPVVVSAEVHARTPREPALRLRFGLRPIPALRDMKSGEVAVSEPVFMKMETKDAVLPNNLDAAALFMTGTLDFNRSDTLALFWESYGFSPDDSVQFQLRVNRNDDPNIVRRVGSMLGLASDLRDSVTIRWTEPDARNGASVLNAVRPVVGRSVALDFKALAPGRYIIAIEMRAKNNAFARSERAFQLR